MGGGAGGVITTYGSNDETVIYLHSADVTKQNPALKSITALLGETQYLSILSAGTAHTETVPQCGPTNPPPPPHLPLYPSTPPPLQRFTRQREAELWQRR